MIECITHDMDKDNRCCRRCGKSEATIQVEAHQPMGYHRRRVAEFLGHATEDSKPAGDGSGEHLVEVDVPPVHEHECERIDMPRRHSEFASGALMALEFAENRKPMVTEIPETDTPESIVKRLVKRGLTVIIGNAEQVRAVRVRVYREGGQGLTRFISWSAIESDGNLALLREFQWIEQQAERWV